MNDIISNLPWNKRIEVLRVTKGWSQYKAAEKCNTNQKTYWNWETGASYPRKNSQLAIARAFCIDINEIFPQEKLKIS